MKDIFKSAIKKSFNTVGLDVHRRADQELVKLIDGNLVVPNVWAISAYADLLAARIPPTTSRVVLLGDRQQIDFLAPAIERRGIQTVGKIWDWQDGAESSDSDDDATIVLCKLPLAESHWRAVKALKRRYGPRLVGIQELSLPFTTIHQAQASLTYSVSSFEELAGYYLGLEFYGDFFGELNSLFPLRGKRIIEFGPMEGSHTAALVNLGAASVTSIEARAVSFIKTMIAQYCLGWKNVTLVMDDFHNADSQTYGTFDLAFAHGVYYHSFAPFLFFENLMSLSDRILIGGYCTGPAQPGDRRETLEYEGQNYLVKRIEIGNTYNNAVNSFAYHFSNEDLLGFFRQRGYDLHVMIDEAIVDPWGERYIRFLATKIPG